MNMKNISIVPFLTKQINDFSNIEKTVRNYDNQYNTSQNIIKLVPNKELC